MILSSTSDLIQLVTAGTQAINVHADWVDLLAGAVTPSRTNTIISSATTTTIVGTPGASTQRNVQELVITNTGGSAETITVQHTDGSSVITLISLSLLAGYTLTWTRSVGWSVIGPNGPLVSTAQGPAAVTAGAWPVKVTDGTNVVGTLADAAGIYGMMVALGATNFALSTANSTTAQLAAGATFTGTIETIYNEQAVSVLLTSDQSGTLTINQYIDLAGTRQASSWVFSVVAGTGFSRSFVANGNYFNLTFKNTGGSTTTTLNVNTAFGILPTQTQLGNQPVSISEINGTTVSSLVPGTLPVIIGPPGTTGSFGELITAFRTSQLQAAFFQAAPSTFLTITTANGGTATQGVGTGIFATSTNANGQVTGVTPVTLTYTAHSELWAAFTASFTTPTSASSYQRIGPYNATDGFAFEYNGTTFGVRLRYNTSDTVITKANWNGDSLTGAVGSKYTSNGVPVALDPTKENLYRIRWGWLGIAPVIFEVLSPDGVFVVVHTQRFPNSQTTVSVSSPNVPMTVDVQKSSSDATNLIITSGCWAAGTSSAANQPIFGVGTIAALNGSTTFPTVGQSALGVVISGTWSGTLTCQYSQDGINWTVDTDVVTSTGAMLGATGATTANAVFMMNAASFRYYRIVATAWSSGTAVVNFCAEQGTSLVIARIKGTTQSLYGASGQVITVTLASLGNSATAARQSTAIDNTTNLFEDANIFVKIKTGASGVSATGYVQVYGYMTVDGTNYPEGVSGSDGAVTLAAPSNLVLLAQLTANANATSYSAAFSFCNNYGLSRLPTKWGLVVANVTGSTFDTTAGNFLVEYQGVNGQVT